MSDKRWMILTVCFFLAVVYCAAVFDARSEDGNNVADQLGNIFSGKGNGYVGTEVNNIPIWGPLTGMAWFDVLAGKIDDGVKRDIRGGVRVAIDWQKIF